jgi:hypothetical protein
MAVPRIFSSMHGDVTKGLVGFSSKDTDTLVGGASPEQDFATRARRDRGIPRAMARVFSIPSKTDDWPPGWRAAACRRMTSTKTLTAGAVPALDRRQTSHQPKGAACDRPPEPFFPQENY